MKTETKVIKAKASEEELDAAVAAAIGWKAPEVMPGSMADIVEKLSGQKLPPFPPPEYSSCMCQAFPLLEHVKGPVRMDRLADGTFSVLFEVDGQKRVIQCTTLEHAICFTVLVHAGWTIE